MMMMIMMMGGSTLHTAKTLQSRGVADVCFEIARLLRVHCKSKAAIICLYMFWGLLLKSTEAKDGV